MDIITPLSKQVTGLLKDLKQQLKIDETLREDMKASYAQLKEHERTGLSETQWREEYLTQAAVAWVLTIVFVRYLEDHNLIEPTIFGDLAQQKQRAYFQQEKHQVDSDTEYLLSIFEHLGQPHAGEWFRAERNPVFKARISASAATKLIKFFRQTDVETGDAELDFRKLDTRFLGDLYQDLSEAVRKKYALLQTPDFVESFILDLTLEPAIDTFGLDEVRFIDPTCGSGHFLLGGFKRIFEKKKQANPTANTIELVRQALNATHGVDINPFAVSIARFRLIVEAFQICEITDWHTQVSLPIHVATGDSLILGQRFIRFETDTCKNTQQGDLLKYRVDVQYNLEDNDLLFGTANTPGLLTQQYHAVVGNPPYFTVRDAKMRKVYKEHYVSCSGKYSLVCPFYERFFELAIGPKQGEEATQMTLGGPAPSTEKFQAGYVGMIVSNAFMKRSYGKKLITDVIPNTDLTHIIDTSGIQIPGCGVPTVILAGRNQIPQSNIVRTVLGIRVEPSSTNNTGRGKVWTSITQHIQDSDFENDFVTISNSDRTLFESHPWSLQGGGALECKTHIEKTSNCVTDTISEIGFDAIMGEDDIFIGQRSTWCRKNIFKNQLNLIEGKVIRNWRISTGTIALFPYNEKLEPNLPNTFEKYFWLFRTRLIERRQFGKNTLEAGLAWYEYRSFYKSKRYTPIAITYTEIATHNHFALDRGGKVFKQTAPIIKMVKDATIDDHLALLGCLNSSTTCFYLKQILHPLNKLDEAWKNDHVHDCTKTKMAPIPSQQPLELARKLDNLAQESSSLEPSTLTETSTPTADALDEAKAQQTVVFEKMVAFQEELDWRCYELYGLLEDGESPLVNEAQWDDMPQVKLGERAFEIMMARKMANGDLETTWFERHGSTPITTIPTHWPQWYQEIVQARIDLIAERRFIRLIEQPVYKRRWNIDAWEDREQDALKLWLLDRLESPDYVPQADREDEFAQNNVRLMRVRDLADVAEKDENFLSVAERYLGKRDFDVQAFVKSLVLAESVPFLPTQRYKDSGLERRREWEFVWQQQRAEDAIDVRTELDEDDEQFLTEDEAKALKEEDVGSIPKPPNYRSSDFQSGSVYKLRGKLDVPKERFILYQDCQRDDGSPVVAWAGLDHRQQAVALAAFYNEVKMVDGWPAERLKLVLAGLKDLLPWVKQWHNDLDPMTNIRLGDFLDGFLTQQARELELGLDAIEFARIGEQ